MMNLLSDAAQSETWPAIKPQLTKGKVGHKHSLARKFLCANIALDALLLPWFFSRFQRPYQGRGPQRY